jgi:hypothetical protein
LGGEEITIMVGTLWFINIVLDILGGILAWNIVEPESFGGGVLFLILWGVFAAIAYPVSLILTGIIYGEHKKR